MICCVNDSVRCKSRKEGVASRSVGALLCRTDTGRDNGWGLNKILVDLLYLSSPLFGFFLLWGEGLPKEE